jgi:hypothetical protein
LRTLNAIGRGILIQLYNIKQLFKDPSRADYVFDPNFVKVNKALMVKFPDLPPLEKVSFVFQKINKQPTNIRLLKCHLHFMRLN